MSEDTKFTIAMAVAPFIWFAFCYCLVALVAWDLQWWLHVEAGVRFIFLLIAAILGILFAGLANA